MPNDMANRLHEYYLAFFATAIRRVEGCVPLRRPSHALGKNQNARSMPTSCPTSSRSPSPFKRIAFMPKVMRPSTFGLAR
jgi:hypothetical protein